MFRKIVSITVIITLLMGILGCASIPEEHKGAATGAGIGAATGAVAGALLGSSGAKTEMALLGGFLGALAGGLIGHYGYDQKKSKEETAKKYNYKTSKGVMVRVENADVVPANAKPGETVDIKMTYAVLGAEPSKELHITETREIKYKGEIFSKPKIQVTRTDGTYTSSVPITLPSDAKMGKYSVIVSVKTHGVSDAKETSFSVK
jgi:surface antigen